MLIPNQLYIKAPRVQTTLISPGALTIPSLSRSSSLEFLSFSVTPHIHLIIILSILTNHCISSALIAHVSLPYIITHWTHALHSFPFTFRNAPLDVRTDDSSRNLLQAHHTLALDASSAPPPAPIISPDNRTSQHIPVCQHFQSPSPSWTLHAYWI